MNEIPDLQTYKRDNPGKSINDYFREYPQSKNISQNVPTNLNIPPQPQIIYVTEETHSSSKVNALNIVACLAVLTGAFLPWIDFSLLVGWPVTGNLFVIPPAIDEYMDVANKVVYKSLYLIPLGAVVAFFGEVLGYSRLRFTGQNMATLPMLSFGLLMYQLVYIVNQSSFGLVSITSLIGLGFYVTLVGCIFFFVDAMSR